ncbi:MAG: DUF167 domain-containing protein [Promethearchaeota archaeon]|jgi:uncharacterized protein (TIGR00251 family)
MSFLKKLNNSTFQLSVKVKPNSKNQKITNEIEFLTIQIRSRAVRNKANMEIINLLKKRFKISSNQVKIVSGLKSTNKVVHIILDEKVEYQSVLNRLLQ